MSDPIQTDDPNHTEDERSDAIRRRAHAIWEEEGRPEGREREHWEQAAREIEGTEPPADPDLTADPDLPGSPGSASDGFEPAAPTVSSGRGRSGAKGPAG